MMSLGIWRFLGSKWFVEFMMQHRSIMGEGINWYYQYFDFPSFAEWRCVPGTDWSINCWRASCSRDRRRYFKEKIRKCSSVREYSLVIPLFFSCTKKDGEYAIWPELIGFSPRNTANLDNEVAYVLTFSPLYSRINLTVIDVYRNQFFEVVCRAIIAPWTIGKSNDLQTPELIRAIYILIPSISRGGQCFCSRVFVARSRRKCDLCGIEKRAELPFFLVRTFVLKEVPF